MTQQNPTKSPSLKSQRSSNSRNNGRGITPNEFFSNDSGENGEFSANIQEQLITHDDEEEEYGDEDSSAPAFEKRLNILEPNLPARIRLYLKP